MKTWCLLVYELYAGNQFLGGYIMKIYDLKEVVKLLGLNIQTIRKFIKEGKLKASKVGTHYMVTEDAIKEFLKANEVQPNE